MAIETSVEARASDVYCGDQTKGSKWSLLSLKSGNEIKKEKKNMHVDYMAGTF